MFFNQSKNKFVKNVLGLFLTLVGTSHSKIGIFNKQITKLVFQQKIQPLTMAYMEIQKMVESNFSKFNVTIRLNELYRFFPVIAS